MINFNDLTQEQRENILSNHITTELLVDRATLNFDNIETDLEGTNLTDPFEVPPIIIDNKHLAQILTHASPDNKGRWIRTMVRTYLEGGRVFYKLNNLDTFIATLTFTK
jgi:hypothetical protein